MPTQRATRAITIRRRCDGTGEGQTPEYGGGLPFQTPDADGWGCGIDNQIGGTSDKTMPQDNIGHGSEGEEDYEVS